MSIGIIWWTLSSLQELSTDSVVFLALVKFFCLMWEPVGSNSFFLYFYLAVLSLGRPVLVLNPCIVSLIW